MQCSIQPTAGPGKLYRHHNQHSPVVSASPPMLCTRMDAPSS
uniref:Uncharacterized protein n=1 Tax=Arundo donax TaxID=35708 RepID=A0A0A9BA64_ARUDO